MTTRRQLLRHTLPLALALLSPSAAHTALAADAASDEVCVMSYNLRYAADKGPNAWPDRRPIMRSLLEQYSPDVFGTQEGVYYQLRELASDLPAYDWIGTGRDGGSRGEFMAVFYKKTRLEPLEFDHFWLSDTPEVIGSTTWKNTNRRMVTWVKFRDRQTKKVFYVWNTHFDHAIQDARERSAQLVRQRMAKLDPTIPLILLGDFNAEAKKNKVYDLLVQEGGLVDSWFSAKERRNEDYNTFNNFQPAVRNGDRIDWILLRGDYPVRATEIITYQRDGQFPSDHFPLAAWLRLP
jgi:endonuclease/exonuclease/phosphatase family metal-dependent hydrolase